MSFFSKIASVAKTSINPIKVISAVSGTFRGGGGSGASAPAVTNSAGTTGPVAGGAGGGGGAPLMLDGAQSGPFGGFPIGYAIVGAIALVAIVVVLARRK